MERQGITSGENRDLEAQQTPTLLNGSTSFYVTAWTNTQIIFWKQLLWFIDFFWAQPRSSVAPVTLARRVQRAAASDNNAERNQPSLQQRQSDASHANAQSDEWYDTIVSRVDCFVRTLRGFDHSNPQSYKCKLTQLESNKFSESLAQLQLRCPELRLLHVKGLVKKYASRSKYFTMSADGKGFFLLNLTPYQADERRVFGEYRCNCGRSWKSAASWKDKYQKCQSCESITYPYFQSILKKSEDGEREGLSPHDMARCQMCVERRKLCVPSRYYAI